MPSTVIGLRARQQNAAIATTNSPRSDEPASDIDIAAVDSLKALGPNGRLEKRTSLLCAMRAGGGGEVYIFCHLEDGARLRFVSLMLSHLSK